MVTSRDSSGRRVGLNYSQTVNPKPETLDPREREFFIANLLVRIHPIIEMVKWTGLAPWEFEIPFPCSSLSTFLELSRQPYVYLSRVDPLGWPLPRARGQPQTLNYLKPKIQTLNYNLKPRTQTLNYKNRKLEPKTLNLKPKTENRKPKT